MHKLLKQSSSVISHLTVPADSSAYARRAPFVVQCRWHFRHFPRFAGELPARGSLYAAHMRPDVSTTLRSAQHDSKKILSKCTLLNFFKLFSIFSVKMTR